MKKECSTDEWHPEDPKMQESSEAAKMKESINNHEVKVKK